MKKLAAALIMLAIVLAGGWFVLRQVAQNRLQDGIAQFRSGLGPDGEFTYATATAAPWRLGADFTDARLRRRGMLTTAAHLALSRVGEHHVGRAMLSDVHFDGSGVGATAATVEATDLSRDAGTAASPVDGAPRLGEAWTGRLWAYEIELHASAKPADSLRVANLALSQKPDGQGSFTQQADFDGVRSSSAGAATGSADHIAERGRWSRSGRVLVDTDVTGLAFPADSPLGQQLGPFGYHGAHGLAHAGLRYDRQAGTAALEPSVRFEGIGVLALSLGLDHLPDLMQQAGMQQAGMQQAQAMTQASLTGLTLTYDDAGLAARVLATMAQRSNVTPAQFQSALSANLAGSLPNENGQQAIRFLNDPRHFVIALRPPAPLSMADIAGLQSRAAQEDIIRTLGFSFKAD